MNTVEDRALQLLIEDEHARADDPEFDAALDRGRADLARIRRGLKLIAAEDADRAPTLRRTTRRTFRRAAAVAAAAAVVGVAVVFGVTRDDSSDRAAGDKQRGGSPALGAPAPNMTLEERVAASDRIIIGTITAISHGQLVEQDGQPGLPYVLAKVSIARTLKPASGDDASVIAFDYDADPTTTSVPSNAGPPWRVGDELLLFLASDRGTVSENIEPAHLQVVGGASGRYEMRDGEVVAPFTVADIVAAVG
jgi:hypothetical protein